MSDQFRSKVERSSFGTQGAKAARRSVSASKAQSLVTRSAASSTSQKNVGGREGK
jgi:hypothetical protein